MRIFRLTFAACVSLAAFSILRADGGYGRSWMDHYYQSPRPADLVKAVYSLNQDGYFESQRQAFVAIGFFSTVFRENPESVDRWLRASAPILPERPRRILAMAAWLAGSPAAGPQIRALTADGDRKARIEANRLLANGPSAPVAGIRVSSLPAMNLQWGAFLASGDEHYVLNVLAALGSDQSGLATSARYALAENAAAHPRVLEICRAELDREPPAIRAEFQAALNEATMKKPGGV